MSAYITSIGTANPKFRMTQQEVLSFMTYAHNLDVEQSRRLELLYRASGISTRYSVLEEFKNDTDKDFFNKNSEPPSTQKRNDIYRAEAIGLSLEAVRTCLSNRGNVKPTHITHLIAVSCTGMYAPGLEIELVKQLGLPGSTERTAVNFMGCYAAFTALKLARSICHGDESAKVLIVCTELCTLHFQQKATDDNLLSNALFGDGSAAVLVEAQAAEAVSLRMNSFQCDLITAGEKEMAWNISDYGFEMKLSAYVPDVVQSGISSLIKNLDTQTSYEFYAVHPGGKKILRVIEEELGISKEQNRFAHDILREYGNMSSPTVLFVLQEVMKSIEINDNGKHVLGLAFGPGLTLESMNLEISIN